MTGFDEEVVALPGLLIGQPSSEDLEPRCLGPRHDGVKRFQVGTLTLVERPGGLWAVRDLTVYSPVRYLSRNGHWSTSGGSGPQWEHTYWHAFDVAVEMARDDHQCLCCHATYTPDGRLGVRNPATCVAPTEGETPVPGYAEIEIPAWCAERAAYVWRGAGGLEFDR